MGEKLVSYGRQVTCCEVILSPPRCGGVECDDVVESREQRIRRVGHIGQQDDVVKLKANAYIAVH